MKTTCLALWACLLWATILQAQPAWEGGLFLGGAAYQGDLVETYLPEFSQIGPAGGLFGRFYLNRAFSLRTDLLYALYTGTDQTFSDPKRQKRNFDFESRLGQAGLLLEWDPLGPRRFANPYRFRKTFSPFFFTGAGAGYLQVETRFGVNGLNSTEEVIYDKQAPYQALRFSLPVGMGLRLDLSNRVAFSGSLTSYYLFTDYLDGISQAGNPETRDWLWAGGVQLTFRMTPRDSDGDGIADKEDACRSQPGVLSARGCPDADGDGVEDAEDACPEAFGLAVHGGCPDSDGDNIMDLIDRCPLEAGTEETEGCPDLDNDCLPDAEDKCPERFGPFAFRGCPDTDNDGFPDYLDPCPLEGGPAENSGCPLTDSDADGVLDRDDPCPLLSGAGHPSGCPDTDKDGLPDYKDRCPELAGLEKNMGCPELKEEEKKLLANAKGSVGFKTGSAILLSPSKKILDGIVSILRKYPFYHLRIEGYTDNRGDDSVNLRLSQKRAKACYDYLISRGIDADRMAHQGFGEAQPIGDNRSEAGRKLNRRVEFNTFVPN